MKMAVAGLHGLWVEQRHAACIQRQARLLQLQCVDIGRAPGGGQQIIEALAVLFAACIAEMHQHGVAVAFDAKLARIEVGGQLIREDARGFRQHGWIAEAGDAPATPEHMDAHAQPMQCLAQLQADDPGAEHRHRIGQVVPIEYIVIHHQAIAGGLEGIRDMRTRTGGDDDALGADAIECGDIAVVVGSEHEGVRIFECSMRTHDVCRVEAPHRTQHETDEAITLLAHPAHDRAAIDLAGIAVDAERGQQRQLMACLRRRDQQFRGHAAHAGAGSAERPAFDQGDGVGVLAYFAIGRHAGSAAADDGDVDLAQAHAAVPRAGSTQPGRTKWQV